MFLTFRADGTIWVRTGTDRQVYILEAKLFWLLFMQMRRDALFDTIRLLVTKASITQITEIPAATWDSSEGFAVPLLPEMPVWGAGAPLPGRGHNFFSKGTGRIAIAHGGYAILRDLVTPHIFEAEQGVLVNPWGEQVADFIGNDISAGKGFDPDSKARRGMFVCGHTIRLRGDEDNLSDETVIALNINGTPGYQGQKTIAQYARNPNVLVPELFQILGGAELGPSCGFAVSIGAAAKNDPASNYTPAIGNLVAISITGFPDLIHGVAMS